MTRRLDVLNVEAMAPSASGGCGSGACSCSGAPEPPPVPAFGAVRLDGREIPPEAIAREIQYHPASSPEEAWSAAARALVVRELLLAEAARRGLEAADDGGGEARAEDDQDALVRSLLDQTVDPAVPGEDECRRYYDQHGGRFRTPDLFEAAHILIEPDGDSPSAWAAAEQTARALAESIGDGRRAFAEAARLYSACPSAQQDGSLGQVRRGELVSSVQTAIEALAPGTSSREPVRSKFGWHIIRLERCIEGHTLPFELVCDKIADMLEARSWTMSATRFVADLASRARIEGVAVTTPGAW